MNIRALCLLPFIWAVILLVGHLASLDLINIYEVLLVKGLAFVGSLAAVFTFNRGEYLRRAFVFLSICTLCLVMLSVCSLLPHSWSEMIIIDALKVLFVTCANAFQVAGMLVLARTWRVAGLNFPVSPLKKTLLTVVVVGVSLLVAGPAMWIGIKGLIDGSMGGSDVYRNMVSGLGDTISLCLIAPLLLTAWALRGGILSWTWIFITASMLAWLGYDAVTTWGLYVGFSIQEIELPREIFRAMGSLFWFACGWSQLIVRKQVQTRTASK